jgi:hypothetical protein
VKNAYAQEVDKNENLTKELTMCHDSITNLINENASLIVKIDKLNESISSLKTENDILISKAKDLNVCNDSISNLRNENAILHAKIDELNVCKPSTSTVGHVSICTRCRDEHEIKNEKFKFARSMLYNGRRPGIRMALVSNREAMSSLMPLRNCLTLLRAKLPWFRIMKVTFYIMLIILSTRLGEFMLRNLIMFLTMHLCIRMRFLALGNQHMLNCLKRKLLLQQMSLIFRLRLLMLLMCLLTNQAK